VLGLPVGIVAAGAAVLAVLPRDSKSAGDELDGIADNLANIVGPQWDNEAGLRGFGGLHSLRVSWTGATECFEPWEYLERTACDAGRQGSGNWAAGPGELAGSELAGSELAAADDATRGICAVLDRVPTGRLVTLGQPGAGKSMLLIRLARGLLARRRNGDPVPVIVSLASWDPKDQKEGLYDWLLTRLSIDYPSLRQPFGRGEQKTTRGDALLGSGKILLILDGLDEIDEESRSIAIQSINNTLGQSRGLVLACRKEEYEEATRPESGAPVSLMGAAGIILEPLEAQEVKDYLQRGALSAQARARWDRVVAVLGTDHELGKTLTTPLAVTLAHAVYNPGLHARPGSLPDPDDLLGYPTEASIKEHLFGAFIEAAYSPWTGSGRDRPPPQANLARRWLTFLACNPGLAWWELPAATPVPLVEITVGVVCGIAAGIAAMSGSHAGVGVGFGLGIGIMVGLVFGIPFRSISLQHGPILPASAEDPTPARGIAGGLVGGIVGGLVAGLAAVVGFGHAASAVSGMPVALGVGLAAGACTTFYGGIAGGLFGGFAAGALEGVGTGQTAGIVNGLGIGLVVMLIIRRVGRDTPAARRKWEYQLGVPGGLAVGVATGIIAGVKEGPAVGLVLGASLGLVSAWPIGLKGIKTAQTQIRPVPRRALARDARAFWTTALAAGLAAGAFGFGGDGLASVIEVHAKLTVHRMISDGLAIGIASGLVVGLAFGVYHSASPGFLIIRVWLSARGEVPWRYMDFLEDAHTVRRVLRQNGARYEFAHDELRNYLAQAAESENSGREPPRLNFDAYREVFTIWRVRSSA
jgi:hypothetical protein